ncbi:hypothetical protein [Paenibacillus odorifer]|uniref:hypothetical protein n=1 Tax=Paenibacillus odorifer TaxID=189426 RepID=UPI00096DDAE5|nr:hypothetical protein [Paenibacillus odorifer]OMD76837.1 hypothetical protein BSK50_13880 [Paenibacillus odorifer]
MGQYSKGILFKKQINELMTRDWRIVFNPETENTIIIDEHGTEISNSALGFVGSEINDYINRREEETLGEKRKKPLDEFTIKRQGIEDYVLIEGITSMKSILEVYHDKNEMFIMEKFAVSPTNNLRYDEYNAYLTLEQAEKVLHSLQSFVDKKRREE